MGNLFEYLAWRGDLTLAQSPFNAVDNLILTTLTYIHFRDIIPQEMTPAITIGESCTQFLALPQAEQISRVRCKNDQILAEKLADCARFRDVKICCYAEETDLTTESQFAAMIFLLGEDTAFVSYRGTDNTIVGWKEDFNMSFQETIPAQHTALNYLEEFAEQFSGEIRVGGHSKGGNLAVYAAAKAHTSIRARIVAVYNNDGPGFWRSFLDTEGYGDILLRIQTYIPQSSIFGVFLEHEEPYTVVRSTSIGALQHDPYNWTALGNDFIRCEEVTSGSRILDLTFKSWLERLSNEQREEFVDAIYQLLVENEFHSLKDMQNPRGVYAILKSLAHEDEETLLMLTRTIGQLVRAARRTLRDMQNDNLIF